MDEVVLAEYDPHWPQMFEEEAARVREAVGEAVLAVEHFGSTAIPGLVAKPVIDLMVCVRSLAEARQSAVPALEALGYAYWAEDPAPDRMFFVKGLPPNGPRTHHVHLVEPTLSYDPRLGHFEFRDRLLFRDYLRAHPEEAARYVTLKRELAARLGHDREAYTSGKTDYVYAVMELARQEQAGRQTE